MPHRRGFSPLACSAAAATLVLVGLLGPIPSHSPPPSLPVPHAIIAPRSSGRAYGGGPPGRTWASLAYDAADGYTVLFGGYNEHGYLGDTWTFVGGVWTNVTPANSPPARDNGVMAYDPVDGYVVLYGGHSSKGDVELRDTWTYRAGVWTNLTGSEALSPGTYADGSLTYDPNLDALLYVGGEGCTGEFCGDDWTFSHGSWAVAGAGPLGGGVTGFGLAYDVQDTMAITYGGCCPGSANSFYGRETLGLVGSTWQNVSQGPLFPPPLNWPAMAYDPNTGQVVMFGGGNGPAGAPSPGQPLGWDYNQTFTFQGDVWSSAQSSTDPPAIDGASMVYDATDGYLLLFGGATYGTVAIQDGNVSGPYMCQGDSWAWTGSNWTHVGPGPVGVDDVPCVSGATSSSGGGSSTGPVSSSPGMGGGGSGGWRSDELGLLIAGGVTTAVVLGLVVWYRRRAPSPPSLLVPGGFPPP